MLSDEEVLYAEAHITEEDAVDWPRSSTGQPFLSLPAINDLFYSRLARLIAPQKKAEMLPVFESPTAKEIIAERDAQWAAQYVAKRRARGIALEVINGDLIDIQNSLARMIVKPKKTDPAVDSVRQMEQQLAALTAEIEALREAWRTTVGDGTDKLTPQGIKSLVEDFQHENAELARVKAGYDTERAQWNTEAADLRTRYEVLKSLVEWVPIDAEHLPTEEHELLDCNGGVDAVGSYSFWGGHEAKEWLDKGYTRYRPINALQTGEKP